jgi:hypothetical protein
MRVARGGGRARGYGGGARAARPCAPPSSPILCGGVSRLTRSGARREGRSVPGQRPPTGSQMYPRPLDGIGWQPAYGSIDRADTVDLWLPDRLAACQCVASWRWPPGWLGLRELRSARQHLPRAVSGPLAHPSHCNGLGSRQRTAQSPFGCNATPPSAAQRGLP